MSEWPRVRLPVLIHHSGYRRAALARKQGRNRRLLLAMLAEREVMGRMARRDHTVDELSEF